MRRRLIIIFTILLTVSYMLPAQAQNGDAKYQLGIKGGVMNYFGDLSYKFPKVLQSSRLGYGLQVERNLGNGMGIRLSGSKGQFSYADQIKDKDDNFITDNPNFDRDLNFETNIYDGSLEVVFYPKQRGFITPYLGLGAGLTFFDVFADENKDDEFNTDLKRSDYSEMAFHIPATLGFKFQLGRRLNLNLETSLKYAFSDFLDDVDNTVENLNPDQEDMNDFYNFTSASLNFNLGVPAKKRKFTGPILIADKYSVLSAEDRAYLKETDAPTATKEATNATTPDPMAIDGTIASDEVTAPASKKEAKAAKKAAKAAKKDNKEATKAAKKACKEACKNLETRAERKACRKNCKDEENYIPYIVNADNGVTLPSQNPVTEEQYETKLDSLKTVIAQEQQENSTAPAESTNIPAPIVMPAPAPVIVPPAPAPAPAPIIINSPAPAAAAPQQQGPSEGDMRSLLNERDVQDLKLQLEILKLKQEQAPNNNSNTVDPTAEMYKLEAERLRQESMERKIIGEIEKMRLEMGNMKSQNVEKEIIIEKMSDDKSDKKSDKEYQKTIEKLDKQIEKLEEDLKDMKSEKSEVTPSTNNNNNSSNISNDELLREIERLRKDIEKVNESKAKTQPIQETVKIINEGPIGPSNQALQQEIDRLKQQLSETKAPAPIIVNAPESNNDDQANALLQRQIDQLNEELKKKETSTVNTTTVVTDPNVGELNRKIDRLNNTIDDLEDKIKEVQARPLTIPTPVPVIEQEAPSTPAPRIVIQNTAPTPQPTIITTQPRQPIITNSIPMATSSGRPYPWEQYYQNSNNVSTYTTTPRVVTPPRIITNPVIQTIPEKRVVIQEEAPLPPSFIPQTPVRRIEEPSRVTNTYTEPIRQPVQTRVIYQDAPIIRRVITPTVENTVVTRIVNSYNDIARYIKATIFFDSNSTAIRDSEAQKLNTIADVLNSYPEAIVNIEGYADRTGTSQQNLVVSEERAMSVKNKLINEFGIEAYRLLITYFGFDKAPKQGADPLYRKAEIKFLENNK